MKRRSYASLIPAIFLTLLLALACAACGSSGSAAAASENGGTGGGAGSAGATQETLPPDPVYDDSNAIYVSTTGSDTTGDGSLAAPYLTISHALGEAPDSGTILLRGGTYNEALRVERPVTIRSYTGEWAVIQQSSDIEYEPGHAGDPDYISNDVTVHFHLDCAGSGVDSSGSRLQRLEIVGGFYGVAFETLWDWGCPNDDRHGVSNVLIEDCKIHDTVFDSVKVKPNADNITIRRTEIYNSGAGYPPGTPQDDKNSEGIDNVNGDNLLVQDSVIHDTATNGIYCKGGAINCIVERTRVYNAGGGGILMGFDTSPEYFDLSVNPQYYENIGGIVRNCIVSDTGYEGIGMYASRDVRVANNTVVNANKLNAHSAIYLGVATQDYEPTAGRPPNLNPIIQNNIVVQGAGLNPSCVGIRYSDDLGGLQGLSGGLTIDNNDYFVEGGSCTFFDRRPSSVLDDGTFAQWQAHISGETNSMEADPLLDADEHLLANSPCIDKAVNVDYVSYDIDRELRTGTFDIGADERP